MTSEDQARVSPDRCPHDLEQLGLIVQLGAQHEGAEGPIRLVVLPEALTVRTGELNPLQPDGDPVRVGQRDVPDDRPGWIDLKDPIEVRDDHVVRGIDLQIGGTPQVLIQVVYECPIRIPMGYLV